MKIVVPDFETYFSNEYGLGNNKMTTEEYVRDSRFKAHMLGVKVQGKDPIVLAPARIHHFKPKPEKVAFVCHHAHFDGLILSHHYNIRPVFWFDTLSMSRLVFPHAKSHSLGALAKMLNLPEKSVPYESFKNVRDLPPELYDKVALGCANDCELTYAIFQKMLPYMPKDELRIIDLTIRMFTEPQLKLDRQKLIDHIQTTQNDKDELLERLGVTREELGSADKFAALLSALGVEAPTKISKKTGKVIYAFAKTDAGMKDLLEDEDDRVRGLVEARLSVKSNTVETRAVRMLNMDARGSMCVYLKYYGAHVGRWSGGDKMNWQNFKRSTPTKKSVVREAIMAPPGYVVVVVDAAQIEARMLDWLSGEAEMLEKWRARADLYSEIATEFYGEPVDKSKPDKRGMGKQIILSCGFGAGADSIKNTARIGTYGPPVILTDEQALAARDLYRRTHRGVVGQWYFAGDKVLPALLNGTADFAWGPMQVKGQRIYMPGGAWIDYTNLRHNGEEYYQLRRSGVSKTYGGKTIQNVIEGLSRTLLKENMLKIAPRYRIVTDTHDEIVYLARIAEAEEALQFGLACVRTPPVWAPGIPLEAEGGYASNYGK